MLRIINKNNTQSLDKLKANENPKVVSYAKKVTALQGCTKRNDALVKEMNRNNQHNYHKSFFVSNPLQVLPIKSVIPIHEVKKVSVIARAKSDRGVNAGRKLLNASSKLVPLSTERLLESVVQRKSNQSNAHEINLQKLIRIPSIRKRIQERNFAS